MKFSPLSVLIIAFLSACSNGNNQTVDDQPLSSTQPVSELIDDPLSLNEAVESTQLINSGLLGPEPNYWQCQLTQSGASTPLDQQYQFFEDQTGVVFLGPTSGAFRWELHQDTTGRLDIYNDDTLITHERWFVDSHSPTVFVADIAYAISEEELADLTFIDTDATLRCILYVPDGGPVNPDDLLDDTFDDEGNAIEPTSDIPPVALAIVNTSSSFGIENELWYCISDDGSLDLLLGFFDNGIGGTYTIRNGTLEGAQSSYTVSETANGATVIVNAVFNNEADQLELLDVEFEHRFQFSTRIRSAALNVDATATCDTIQTSQLPI